MTVQIRATQATDASAFRDLRLEALRSHPEAFGADYATNEREPMTFWEERASHPEDDPNQTIFFAVADDQLMGMCGIFRGTSPKTRHGATIWGVYVRPAGRGQQLADQLIHTALGWARRQEVHLVKLTVVTTNTGAIRCYARCGFTVYGIEPKAICYDGRYYDELLMVQHL